MPKIRFRSLPSGPVSVAVSQRGSTTQAQFGTVEEAGPEPGEKVQIGTATIEVNRDRGTAPAGFFFSIKTEGFTSADPTFDPYSDLHYRWCFNDPGWYTRHDSDDLPWGRWYDVAGERVLMNDGTVPKGDGDVTFLGNDKDVAYGPHCCHVFAPTAEDFAREASKRFTVICEIRSRSTKEPVLVVTRDVIVDNPDAIFARSATYCISNGGVVHGDEPVGATVYATIAAAAAAGASSKQPRRRYLLRRGEMHAAHTNSNKLGGSIDKVMIGSYGQSSSPPKIELPTSINWGNTSFPFRDTMEAWGSGSGEQREVIISGFDLTYAYDPSDPNGVTYMPPVGVDIRSGDFKTIWDMRFSGLERSIATRGPGINDIAIGNTLIENYFNYGMFIHGNARRFGCAGVWIKQHPRAVKGGGGVGGAAVPKSAPWTVAHTTARLEQLYGPLALNLVDLRSVAGAEGVHQPSLRLMGTFEGAEVEVVEGVIDRMRAEGGQAINQAGDASNKEYPATARKFIFDKAYIMATHGTEPPVSIQVTGPVVRNCVVVLPSNPLYLTGDPTKDTGNNSEKRGQTNWLHLHQKTWKGWLFSESLADYLLPIYNNTFLQMRQSADQRAGDKYFPDPEAQVFRDKAQTQNNIFAFPFGSPDYANDPAFGYVNGAGSNYCYVPNGGSIAGDWLDLTPLWTSGIKGYWYIGWYDADPAGGFDTRYAVAAADAILARPKTGSPLAGGADKNLRVAVDDFFGRIRGADPSRGAVEPA